MTSARNIYGLKFLAGDAQAEGDQLVKFQTIAVTAVASATFAVAAYAQGAAPAVTPPSLDGHYQGTLVCERMPNTPGTLRAPLDIMISGTDARFARPMFTLDDSRVTGSEMATGTLGSDGKVQFASRGENINATYQASYSGTISLAGGTLSGSQTFSTPGGTRVRACHAAFVKVGR